MATAPKVQADFTKLPAAVELLSKRDASGAKLSKFLPNPTEWGPGSRGTQHAAVGSHGAVRQQV